MYRGAKGTVMAHVPMSQTNLDAYPNSGLSSVHDERVDLLAVRKNLFDGEAVDRVFRARGSTVELLAVTTQRIIMVERVAWDGRIALTSVPFGRVSAVSLMADDQHSIDEAVVLGFRVQSLAFELNLGDPVRAREAHDLLMWALLHW